MVTGGKSVISEELTRAFHQIQRHNLPSILRQGLTKPRHLCNSRIEDRRFVSVKCMYFVLSSLNTIALAA